jgi:hypothetical protein
LTEPRAAAIADPSVAPERGELHEPHSSAA